MEGLGISLPTLVAQVVNVVILLVLLRLVAYKPIMRMLDERAARVKENIEQAQALKEQMARSEEETRLRLEAASREGQERIARAAQAGEEVKKKAQEEARREAEVLLERARAEILRERDSAIGELRREFGDMTILAAEKVIDRSLDKEAHRQLIDRVLEESSTLKKG